MRDKLLVPPLAKTVGDQLELAFGPLRMIAIHSRRASLTFLGSPGNDVLVSCMNLIR
jgi:hypothetical protein